jgi:hypothetical protein
VAGDNAVVVAGVATVGIVVAAVGIAAAAAASLASMLRAAAAVVAVEAAADIVVEQSGVGHAVAAHTADNTAAAAAAAAARTADSLQQPLPAASDVCGVCECLHVYNVSEWCAYWRQAQAEDVECTSHYRFKGQG